MSIATAKLIPLRKAGRLFPSRPDRRTLWRWTKIGVEGRHGRRVKLHSTVIAGRIYVSEADVERFIREQQTAG